MAVDEKTKLVLRIAFFIRSVFYEYDITDSVEERRGAIRFIFNVLDKKSKNMSHARYRFNSLNDNIELEIDGIRFIVELFNNEFRNVYEHIILER